MTQQPPAPHPDDRSGQEPTQHDPTQGAPSAAPASPYAGSPQVASPYGAAPQNAPYGAPRPGGAGAAQPSPYAASAASAGSASSAPHATWGGGEPTPGYPVHPANASSTSGVQRVGFFKALFDFRFEHFITLKFAGVLYLLSWIVAALIWLWNIVSALLFGFAFASRDYYGGADFTAWPLIVAVLFGWIPSVLAILALRLVLEFSVATVRTAENTTALARRATTGGSDD